LLYAARTVETGRFIVLEIERQEYPSERVLETSSRRKMRAGVFDSAYAVGVRWE
jgi:hypothetical protein